MTDADAQAQVETDPEPAVEDETEHPTASPIPGTERTVGEVTYAECANCDDEIWEHESGWDWEHVDTDNADCA